MSSLPKPTKYARRSGSLIRCYVDGCALCFGEIVDGIAQIDDGFRPSARALTRHRHTATHVERQDAPGNRGQRGPLALTAKARWAYEKACREGWASRFRARSRRGSQTVLALTGDTQIECPQHGLQVISLDRLGAFPFRPIQPAPTQAGGGSWELYQYAGRRRRPRDT